MREFASIRLDKGSDAPMYRQLGDAFRGLIATGVLKPHKKLPPIRTIARALRINNDTVVNAYKYLENIGAVYSVVGSGTYVNNAPAGAARTMRPLRPCFRLTSYERTP